jgi:PPOX class probable F420-dependent enzyme
MMIDAALLRRLAAVAVRIDRRGTAGATGEPAERVAEDQRMINFKEGFPAQASARLRTQYVIWLTTVDAANVPQPRPVWYHWDGATILIFSQARGAKVRHVARHPAVSVNLNSDPRGDEVTVLLGTAAILPTWPTGRRVDEYLQKYAEGIAGLDFTPESFKQEYSIPIEITPTAVRGF